MSTQTWSVCHNHVRGQCTIASTGITFKSSPGVDEKVSIVHCPLGSKVSLLILGSRTHELRITRPDGTHVRFDGFKRDDAENIITLFQTQFSVTVTTEQPSSSGKNFGELILNNDQIILTIDNKIAMEMRTEDIAQVVKQGDDQVELQFEERPLQGGSDAQLMRIQFFVPEDHSSQINEDDDDDEELDEEEKEIMATGAGRLRKRLVAAAGITSVTGEKILALPDDVGTFLAPRGRYVGACFVFVLCCFVCVVCVVVSFGYCTIIISYLYILPLFFFVCFLFGL